MSGAFSTLAHLGFDAALLFSGWVIAREMIGNRHKIAAKWLGEDGQ